MPKHSAGLLPFRRRNGAIEVLLVHLGGPFWSTRDAGAWFIPKGEIEPGEDELAAACREFREETGFEPSPPFLPLGEIRQRSGKRVTAFAFEGEADPAALRSNTFAMEWPPKSGRMREFPEVDRAAWFDLPAAGARINQAEAGFLARLSRLALR
jgi:predicted NUDIX family NTP pyrophosphohydrolase